MLLNLLYINFDSSYVVITLSVKVDFSRRREAHSILYKYAPTMEYLSVIGFNIDDIIKLAPDQDQTPPRPTFFKNLSKEQKPEISAPIVSVHLSHHQPNPKRGSSMRTFFFFSKSKSSLPVGLKSMVSL